MLFNVTLLESMKMPKLRVLPIVAINYLQVKVECFNYLCISV